MSPVRDYLLAAVGGGSLSITSESSGTTGILSGHIFFDQQCCRGHRCTMPPFPPPLQAPEEDRPWVAGKEGGSSPQSASSRGDPSVAGVGSTPSTALEDPGAWSLPRETQTWCPFPTRTVICPRPPFWQERVQWA